MGFLDWLRQASGWVYNKVAKPLLSGASWLRNQPYFKPAIEGLGHVPVLGTAARIASSVVNTLGDVHDWTQEGEGKAVADYLANGGGGNVTETHPRQEG